MDNTHILPVTYANWEAEFHHELTNLYRTFFENNRAFQITYEDFVVYCYKHSTIRTLRSRRWRRW